MQYVITRADVNLISCTLLDVQVWAQDPFPSLSCHDISLPRRNVSCTQMTTEMFTILLTDSLKEKAMFILRATFQHAKNLAFLTTIYKTILLILKKLQGRTLPVHNFIGAFVAGYFVFGENNKVNMQVNKSCTSILYTIMILCHVFRSICIYCRGSALVWLGWP